MTFSTYFKQQKRLASPYYVEKVMKYLFMILAISTTLIILLLLLILLKESLLFFSEVPATEFFLGTHWNPFSKTDKSFGALPLISGTLQIAVGSGFFALPTGLLIAVFLSQYCSKRIREIFSSLIEVFAGIPSIVYGMFAVITLTPLLRYIFPEIEVFNALAASLAVGISVLPMVSSIIFNAIISLPKNIVRGGYALGLHKFHVISRIILPAILSSIIAAFLLAFSRAIGETMAVTLAAGATPKMGFDYLSSIQTITAYIVQVSLGDVSLSSLEYHTIYALGLTLFCITLLFNFASNIILNKNR